MPEKVSAIFKKFLSGDLGAGWRTFYLFNLSTFIDKVSSKSNKIRRKYIHLQLLFPKIRHFSRGKTLLSNAKKR